MTELKATMKVVQRPNKKIVEVTIWYNDEIILKFWENLSYKISGSFFNHSIFEVCNVLQKEDTLRYELTRVSDTSDTEEIFKLKFITEHFSKNPKEFLIDIVKVIN